MQRKVAPILATIILVGFLTWVGLFLILGIISPISVYALSSSSTPTVVSSSTSTASASDNSSQSTPGIDPAIWAALIGLGGVVVGALIAGIFVVYQVRRTAEVEKQRQIEQFQHEEQMARLQKELEAQYTVKERQEQSEATKAEAQRLKMLLAPNSERAQAYREALHVDPRISHLQILDMSRPLEVTNVYVRVRLHQETRTTYELDPAMRAAETRHDPNALLQASFKHLEHRASKAIDPDEAIRTYKRCVFVGDPGAGKTTLLKYLTLKAADNQLANLPDLPIRIELNAFASSGHHDLLDFAAADWDERYGFPKADARAAMEEPLKTGNALLLLDALDETVIGSTPEEAEASYQAVATAIIQLSTRYPQAPIVVTVRKAGYQQRAPLTGFTELEVLDFRLEDMQQFVTNWFNCYTDPQKRANGSDLNTKLERNPRIQALAANPLLLSLIVLVYEAQLDLPERRAELYKRCMETLLTEWDAKRNIRRRREFKPEHKRQLLAELAWHFHQQGRRYFPESEVLMLIADFLPKVRLQAEQNGSVLAEIANEHGLLKEQARGWQGFLHLTLQEYFVAQYVTDHQQLDTLLTHRGDPWWEEVLLLYAGHTPDASPLLRKLIGQEDKEKFVEDIFHTNLVLAGRCLAARPTIQQASLWDTIINQLFDTLMTTKYTLIRELVAEDLVAIGGVEVNKRLLGLLANEQMGRSVRGGIARALGQLGERVVVPELVQLLTNEQVDMSVREGIARALGQLGERAVVPELVQLLADERVDMPVRGEIARALGQLGERTVVPELVQLLTNEQVDRDLRRSIARALGQLGERTVVSELVQLLANDRTDWSVRGEIARALGQLGERAVAPELVQLLANKQMDWSVRGQIARALGQLGERAVVPELVQLLAAGQVNRDLRWGITYALGQLGERAVVPELVQLLANEQVYWSVRWDIAYVLGQLGERAVVPELVQLLANEQVDWSVRKGIAYTLGQLGERAVVPELVQLLANEQVESSVRGSIARVLGQLGERAVVPELVQLLADERVDWDVRREIPKTLGELADDEATVRALAALLPMSGISDDIHQTLWAVSRRAGARVFAVDGANGQEITVARW